MKLLFAAVAAAAFWALLISEQLEYLDSISKTESEIKYKINAVNCIETLKWFYTKLDFLIWEVSLQLFSTWK